jgi:hypothetical protein
MNPLAGRVVVGNKKPAPMYQARIVLDITILTTKENEDAAKKIIERLSVFRSGWSPETGDYDLKAFANEVVTVSPFDPNPHHRTAVEQNSAIEEGEIPTLVEGPVRNNDTHRTSGDFDLF